MNVASWVRMGLGAGGTAEVTEITPVAGRLQVRLNVTLDSVAQPAHVVSNGVVFTDASLPEPSLLSVGFRQPITAPNGGSAVVDPPPSAPRGGAQTL